MKTILIIEDDKVLRENTKELLELSDYKVFIAGNGKVGIEKTFKHIPDLILCDIWMPQLDGYGVLDYLSSHNQTRNIPFLFFTAKTDLAQIKKGMNLGADDYITKPFSEIKLLNAIKNRLKKFA